MSHIPQDPPQGLVDLPTRAQELRAQAEEILSAAEEKAAEIRAQAELEAETLRRAAGVLDGLASSGDVTPLRSSAQHANVRNMKKTHKLALSAAHSKTRLSAACRAAGKSLNEVAVLPSVRSAPTTLRNGHSGKRSIPESVCKRVEKALGFNEDGTPRFPATLENWPKMRVGK